MRGSRVTGGFLLNPPAGCPDLGWGFLWHPWKGSPGTASPCSPWPGGAGVTPRVGTAWLL